MIRYYNTFIVPNHIKNDRQNTEKYLSADFSDQLFEQYNKFGLNRYNMVYDRTKSIPHYLNITPDIHPMPGYIENYNTSFWEVTERRAKELLALDKPINVLWSGGIDSTYTLFVLRHFANDPDQVRICGTYNSILESGNLFDRRLRHEFKHTIRTTGPHEQNFDDPDAVYISGMGGNQLFGPTDNMFANGSLALFHHTLGTPDTIYKSYKEHIDTELLEFLDPAIKASPRKLETVADLRWYCIFNLDWYTGVYEHKTQLPAETAERIHGFFDSWDFQTWAVNTKEPFTKVPGNPNTHRWQMREALADMFGEPDYAVQKKKLISTFSINDHNWMFLLDGYKNIYTKAGTDRN
jgi:hypothetical protein